MNTLPVHRLHRVELNARPDLPSPHLAWGLAQLRDLCASLCTNAAWWAEDEELIGACILGLIAGSLLPHHWRLDVSLMATVWFLRGVHQRWRDGRRPQSHV